MTEKIKKDMIDGNIVNSVVGIQVDLSDPENPALPEFLLPDGSNSNGGTFFIDQILSDRFANYKQVLTALLSNAIEYGNIELAVHRFLMANENGMKVKVDNNEGTVWHSLNFDAEQFDSQIPDWSSDLENNTNF